MKEFLVYTLARIGLFLGIYLLLAVVWGLVRGWHQATFLWPFLAAAVISSLVSIRLLAKQREAFAQRVDARAHRVSQRVEQMRAREDVD